MSARRKRRGVVDAVARHRDDLGLVAKRVRYAQLGLGRAARKDERALAPQESVELGLGQPIELGPGDDAGLPLTIPTRCAIASAVGPASPVTTMILMPAA